MQEQLLEVPPYASHLVFVLSEDDSEKQFVEVYYNSPDLYSLKLCKNFETQQRCPYDKFVQLYNPFRLPDAELQCDKPLEAETNTTTPITGSENGNSTSYLLVFGIVLVGGLLIGLGAFAYFYIKNKQNTVEIVVDESIQETEEEL